MVHFMPSKPSESAKSNSLPKRTLSPANATFIFTWSRVKMLKLPVVDISFRYGGLNGCRPQLHEDAATNGEDKSNLLKRDLANIRASQNPRAMEDYHVVGALPISTLAQQDIFVQLPRRERERRSDASANRSPRTAIIDVTLAKSRRVGTPSSFAAAGGT